MPGSAAGPALRLAAAGGRHSRPFHGTRRLRARGAGAGFGQSGARHPGHRFHPYNIASVSKPISAVVALRLVELGLLDLDRPMASFGGFGEFCREARAGGGSFFGDFGCAKVALTLHRVLSMTANGVPGTCFLYNTPAYSWASRPLALLDALPR